MENIEAIAEKLRADAKLHRDMGRKLDEAADILLSGPSNGRVHRATANRASDTALLPASRIDQLKEYLGRHPGKKRAEIIAETDIPVGTIGSLLKKENGLEKKGTKWYVAGSVGHGEH